MSYLNKFSSSNTKHLRKELRVGFNLNIIIYICTDSYSFEALLSVIFFSDRVEVPTNSKLYNKYGFGAVP